MNMNRSNKLNIISLIAALLVSTLVIMGCSFDQYCHTTHSMGVAVLLFYITIPSIIIFLGVVQSLISGFDFKNILIPILIGLITQIYVAIIFYSFDSFLLSLPFFLLMYSLISLASNLLGIAIHNYIEKKKATNLQ